MRFKITRWYKEDARLVEVCVAFPNIQQATAFAKRMFQLADSITVEAC